MKLLKMLRSHNRPSNADPIQQYLDGGRLPFSPGYSPYRWGVIRQTINDAMLMGQFRQHQVLPAGYGQYLDERVVEYPWLLSRLEPAGNLLLDAGSTLNNLTLLDHTALKSYKKFIVTLAPESVCFWERSISYIFGDLRDLLFRDNYFDVIACISTLEHIGMDNTMIYTSDETFKEYVRDDYLSAVRELRRVLKPGGKCYLTVPFGQYQYDVFQQQFDAMMLERVKETFHPTAVIEFFYRYSAGGWNTATQAECSDCQYFNVHKTKYFDKNSTLDFDADKAAAARAIAALELTK